MIDSHRLIITQLLQPQEQDFPFKNKLHCNVLAGMQEEPPWVSLGFSTDLLSTF